MPAEVESVKSSERVQEMVSTTRDSSQVKVSKQVCSVEQYYFYYIIGHIYRVQWNLVSAFNPSPRNKLQRSAQGPTPDWSRVLTGDRPNIHVLMVREIGGNSREHGENMETPQTKALPQPGIKPRTFLLWGNSAYHWATVPYGIVGSVFYTQNKSIVSYWTHGNVIWQ